MPYTAPGPRKEVYDGAPAHDAGDLTYQLQQVIKEYLHWHGLRFQTVSDITGALHQCQRDFDERIVQPYEAKKREENGDVW